MRKYLVLIALLLFETALFAQHYSYGFKAVNNKETIDKIDYFLSERGCKKVETNTFNGILDGFHYDRSGNEKRFYAADFTVTYSFRGNKVTFGYTINAITKTTIRCDRNQEHVFEKIDLNNELGKFLSEDLKTYTSDIQEFLNEGRMKIRVAKTEQNIFDPCSLSYIVEDDAVSYFRVIPSKKNLSKNELLKILKNYFTYGYRSGKAVIESIDEDNYVILAKGIYSKIHNYCDYEIYNISHVVKVECKDGRVRVVITIGDYDIITIPEDFTRNIVAYEPFGSKKDKEMVECLEKLEKIILVQFNEMQKAIDEGNTGLDTIDNW